jgi:hypothetical protein
LTLKALLDKNKRQRNSKTVSIMLALLYPLSYSQREKSDSNRQHEEPVFCTAANKSEKLEVRSKK